MEMCKCNELSPVSVDIRPLHSNDTILVDLYCSKCDKGYTVEFETKKITALPD